jgi:hypothetical protein
LRVTEFDGYLIYCQKVNIMLMLLYIKAKASLAIMPEIFPQYITAETLPRPEPVRAQPEAIQDTPERFIQLQNVRKLVIAVMEDRVHPDTKRLLPLVEQRALMNGPGYWMKNLPDGSRNDMVLPPRSMSEQPYHDGGTLLLGWRYSIQDKIYSRLTHQQSVSLGAAGLERLRYERAKFEHTLSERDDLEWALSDDQLQDAYHIGQKRESDIGRDGLLVQSTRVYIPAGVHGLQVANRIIEAGADFSHAKVWVPFETKAEQEFRQDTPIFTANTLKQLYSIIAATREAAASMPSLFDQPPPLAGIPIEGAPGAYIGQAPEGHSFNGTITDLWEEPIRQAARSLPLRTGDTVTNAWLSEAARRARILAQRQAEAHGMNPGCHALVAGQNSNIVLDAARLPHFSNA